MDVQTRVNLMKRRLRSAVDREKLEEWLLRCVKVAESTQIAFHAKQDFYEAAAQAHFPAPKPGAESLLDEHVQLNFDSYVSLVGLALAAVQEEEKENE